MSDCLKVQSCENMSESENKRIERPIVQFNPLFPLSGSKYRGNANIQGCVFINDPLGIPYHPDSQ